MTIQQSRLALDTECEEYKRQKTDAEHARKQARSLWTQEREELRLA